MPLSEADGRQRGLPGTHYHSEFLPKGTHLDDRYEIIRVLGMGGFGITYEAENIRIHRRVAVKELFCRDYMKRGKDGRTVAVRHKAGNKNPDRDAEIPKRDRNAFLREFRILGSFSDEPGIVQVRDYFEANGTAYIVQEFLSGTTLREEQLRHGTWEAEAIFERMLPVMKTLAKIHQAGIVHGDISPDNIMASKDGTLTLIDFGAAAFLHRTNEEKDKDDFARGQVTDGYAALEQYTGNPKPVSDVYSLAATIYTCITGVVPPSAAARSAYDELKMPSVLGIRIPPDLERILMTALALSLKDRFPSMEEFYQSALSAVNRQKKKRKRSLFRKRMVFAACAAAAVVLVLYAGTHRSRMKFLGKETDTIWVSRPEGMSNEDFLKNQTILRKRMDILAGQGNYLWEISRNKERITITFPTSVLKHNSLKEAAEQYLTASWQTEITAKNVSRDGSYTWTAPVYLLKAGDIRNLKTKGSRGAKDGQTAVYVGMLSDNMRVFVEDTGMSLYLSEDQTKDQVLSTENNPVDLKKGRIEIDLSEIPKSFRKLVLFELTTEPMTADLICDEKQNAVWENPGSSILSGDYERKASEISGDPVILRYVRQFPKNEALSSGERVGTEAVLRERLDALEVPYAVGTDPEDQSAILVKISRKNMPASVAEILPHNFLYTKTENQKDVQYISWLDEEIRLCDTKEKEQMKKALTLALKSMQNEDMPVELSLDGVFLCQKDQSVGSRTSLSKEMFAWQHLFRELIKRGEELGGEADLSKDTFDDPHLMVRFSDIPEGSLAKKASDVLEQFTQKAAFGQWTLSNGQIDLIFSDGNAKGSSIMAEIKKNGQAEAAGENEKELPFTCRITIQSWKTNTLKEDLSQQLNESGLQTSADWTVTSNE